VREIGSSIGLPFVQFYFYSFVAVYLVITALRARYLVGYGKVHYEILEQKQLTPGVFMLRLAHAEKKLMIKAGQYVYLQRNLLSEEHPFTVLDFDNRKGEMSIAYKVYGSFTEKLSELTPGDSLFVDGPYGVFTEEVELDPETPVVFLAAGIGVTPFIKHAMKRAEQKNTWLFYANRTYGSAVFRDYLKKLLGRKYVDILSRESKPAGQYEERGHISSAIISKYLRDPLGYRYFICGPSNMIESSRHALAELGVEEVHIYAEEFGF
jgi:NAD(P)H-flavin reductase